MERASQVLWYAICSAIIFACVLMPLMLAEYPADQNTIGSRSYVIDKACEARCVEKCEVAFWQNSCTNSCIRRCRNRQPDAAKR